MTDLPIQTHQRIDHALCGRPVELAAGRAVVELSTTEAMAVDERGLVHGGFAFGALDHAAMLAVNEPTVVLGAAELRFIAPVRAGETIRCSARVIEAKGKKRSIEASARVGEREVLRGTMTAFVLDRHLFDG